MPLIAAYIPYQGSDTEKDRALSHIKGIDVIIVVLICAGLFAWLFPKRKK